MNCKPGDMAIVIGSSKYSGLIVDVLYLAPPYDFRLPNGQLHQGCPDGTTWVIKMPRKVEVRRSFGGNRMSIYGCGSDSKMRPVSGIPDEESTDTRADLDQPVKEVV